MSLRRKTELAFKALLVAGLPAPHDPVVVGIDVLLLFTGYEPQTSIPGKQRVVINAISGPLVTIKSRNVRMRVEVLVETSADVQVGDATAREVSHSALVLQAHQILDTSDLVTRLQALGGQADIGDFTCFGVSPLGELELPPKTGSRVFRDAWGYQAIVAGVYRYVKARPTSLYFWLTEQLFRYA
jgi:hypothetical protein